MRSDKMKSGPDRFLSRSLITAGGLSEEQLDKPLIGVLNSYTNFFTGHAHQKSVERAVMDGILMGGGTPCVANTIALCDGICENTPGMRYPLVSRDVIANSVEAFCECHSLDGVICIGSCDKIVPGMLMAIMRMNIPAIFISGGMSLPPEEGYDTGENFANMMAAGITGTYAAKKNPCGPNPGCNCGMGTAVSMQMMSEVLGIGMLGNSTVPNCYNERTWMAQAAGKRIVEMVHEDLKPLDIVNKQSFINCLRIDMMMGCSTNTTLHLPSIAAEAGYKITLDDFAWASRSTPQIVKLYPSISPHNVLDFGRAGGMRAVIHQAIEGGYVDGSVKTLYGPTLGEMVAGAKVLNTEIIRPFDHPYTEEGGLAILYGNLSPDGCVIKTGGVLPEMLEHTGRAMVYDSEHECYEGMMRGEVQAGDCVVIRYEGPVAGPGMREMLTITHCIRALGLDRSVSLITDGRFSGGSVGGVIGHVSPEACKGGLIGLVESGDIISYSIPKGTIELQVSDEILAKRRAAWTCPPPRVRTGLLAQYAALALPATQGARMCGDPSTLDDLDPIRS